MRHADYDEQGNPLVSTYTANALNQYTQRTVPGYAALRGEAATNATVTVNERPVWRINQSIGGSAAPTSARSGGNLGGEAAQTSPQSGSYFYGGDVADNTDSSVFKELEVYAAINPSGTNTPDIVSAATGTVFIAKTPEQFTYDADGNMTSDGRFHYFWNGENRLVCASNADVVVTYAYDHRGRMVTKTLCSSAPLRLIKNITYIWDDWNIIREIVREGDSVAVTDNIWGLDLDGTLQGAGGVGGLLAVIRDDGVFLPIYDANGNVSEYVSTNGEIVAHYDYSPFGEPLVTSGPLASTFTHQFSTKPYCPVTGFSEYQMRKYNPEIGRWMSRDMLEEFGGLCLYRLSCVAFMDIDYLGLECCANIGKKRKCSVGLTTVRTLGDPNADDDVQDYLNSFKSIDDAAKVTQTLKYLAMYLTGGSARVLKILSDFLLSQAKMTPEQVANIGKNLAEFYQKRGKITQGVAIWTRICYEECEPTLLTPITSTGTWRQKCNEWKIYKYKSGKDMISFFETDNDAAKHFQRAIESAKQSFPSECCTNE